VFKGLKNKVYKILRWSEKYIKTDTVYLVKGGSWLSLGQLVSIISGLLLSIGLANLVPKEVFGNYKFLLSIAGILGALTLTGSTQAITQAVARGLEGALKKGFWTHLKYDIFVVGISLTGAIYYFVNGNTVLSSSLLIIAVFLPFFLSSVLYASFINGKKDFKRNSIYNIVRTIFSTAILLITIYFTDNVVIIILAYYISLTIPVVYFYRRTIKIYRPKTNVDPDTVSYSKHLSLMNVLVPIANHMDKILLFHFLGAAEVAVYAFSTALPNQLRNINKTIGSLLLPKLSNKRISSIKENLAPKMIFFGIVTAIIAILYIVAAPYIYKLLFPQYLESIIFSQVYALSLLFLPLIFFHQTLVAHMKKNQLYILNFTISIIKIILLFVLLPLYGIWGAIYALFITRVANGFMLSYLFKKL